MPKRYLILLPSAAFQILLALVDGDSHGYGIMRHVAEQTRAHAAWSRNFVRFDPESPGGGVHRGGRASAERARSADRRRTYRLTSAGRRRVRDEAERLEEWLRVARSKKLLEGEYA